MRLVGRYFSDLRAAIDSINALSVGFLGFDGGQAANLLKHKVIINSPNYGVVEDLHFALGHAITQRLRGEIMDIREH